MKRLGDFFRITQGERFGFFSCYSSGFWWRNLSPFSTLAQGFNALNVSYSALLGLAGCQQWAPGLVCWGK